MWINSVLGAASLVALLLVPGMPVLASVSTALLAFGAGMGGLTLPLIAGQLFGTKDYGAIYGLVNFGFMGGCMIGPMFSSSIRTFTGNYTAAWIVYIAVFAAIAIFAVLALKAGDALRENSVHA